MTLLSVNVNKIALLRNARGEGLPDLGHAARVCMEAGCGGITVHPRPDQRHIRPDDVRMLAELCRERVEFNIEGNPFAPPRGSYPGLLALVRETRPTQVTLVPDSDDQLTSNHGFEPQADLTQIAPFIEELSELGCRVSLFVNPGSSGFEGFAAAGAARVEIYTGPFAEAFSSRSIDAEPVSAELRACKATADAAKSANMGVNAGHDLSQSNLAALLAAIPVLAEVSIGHALINEALYGGLAPTVLGYLEILRRSAR